jgi:5'(3')-deoxyribonucleotidase
MNIFTKNKSYTLQEIINICDKNGLITVDCLKDDNMISVEEAGADCLFEFYRISEDIFKLTWFENSERRV